MTRPEHTPRFPRVNVLGRLDGPPAGPCVHLNGHFDVVPAGEGWTIDPFGAEVRDGRLYGRGASDMKSGLAAAAMAPEVLRRAGVPLAGPVEVSGTVDEESGGHAGVAYLCASGVITADRVDYAIIPEPFGPDRICVGHKGVYWCDVTAEGKVAHGSMPHLGHSAIDAAAALIEAVRVRLGPRLASRVTVLPVVPPECRVSTVNVNAVHGGQRVDGPQSPCVADRCVVTFDRRFVPEETADGVRAELAALLHEVEAGLPGCRFTMEDRLVVPPVHAPAGSPLVQALSGAVREVRGADAELVASPGTYDQKHFALLAGVEHCVAYGPGPLQEAHQPDESCSIDDMVGALGVLAVTLARLGRAAGG